MSIFLSNFEQFKKAVGKGDVKKAKKLMKSVNVNQTFMWSYHKTEPIYLIHYICCRGDRNILKMFLTDHEDAIHITTRSGVTTLHFAVLHAKWDIIEELLSRGVDVDAKENGRGFSALHFAVEKKNMGAVKRLLEEGMADINQTNNFGKTPKDLAEATGCKQILNFFQKFEGQTKHEEYMQRLTLEQSRQATEQQSLRRRNDCLEARVDKIESEMGVEVRKQAQDMKTEIVEEVRRLAREEFINVREELTLPPKCYQNMPSHAKKPPPIPPRSRMKSCSSEVKLDLIRPASEPPYSPSSTSTMSAAFSEKVDWFNNLSTSKTSLVSRESQEPPTRHPSVGQIHLHIKVQDGSDSRQNLLDSYGNGSLLDVSIISESDATSGFCSVQDISEEEKPLSNLAKFQLKRNFSDIIYGVKYGKIEPFLISSGVLDEFDQEHLSSFKVNREQMTHLLWDVILKKNNHTLRLFLQALEENGYGYHAKKIRETDALGFYTSQAEQRSQLHGLRSVTSTPNVALNTLRLAEESSEAEENEVV